MRIREFIRDWFKEEEEEELTFDPAQYEAELNKLDRMVDELCEEDGISSNAHDEQLKLSNPD